MTARTATRRIACSLTLLGLAGAARAGSDFFTQPNWQLVTPESALTLLDRHLAAENIPPNRLAEIRELWDADGGDASLDVLDRLAQSLAKTDAQVKELVEFCAGVSKPGPLPEFAWLADSATPELVRNNMRLFLARWLVQQGYYDEALSWSDGLVTEVVVAPEALLFYRAVAHHRLVQPEHADAALARLLQREEELPTRYQKLAALMQQDLAGLDEQSLDHIARRMEDVRRRLAQGRSGKRVQGIENGVIESLDKLIKELEDQMQQQQQQSQSQQSPGGQPQGSPMQDSQIAELKAPGSVERRDIGSGSGWGNLPDKDREKALQEIGREFPSHYREVIEEYFRRLAGEESAERP